MRLGVIRGNFPSFLVSIHASVKDATQIGAVALVYLGFNPRICKRCDAGIDIDEYFVCKFQSTHL